MTRLTLSEQLKSHTEALTILQAENAALKAEVAIKSAAAADADKARAKITELTEALAKAEKALESEKGTRKYNEERASKAESEIEQAHAVLDSVEGAPAREYEQQYGKGYRNVVTRLAGAFMAIARSMKV
jgi:chromosome segregation ATPase